MKTHQCAHTCDPKRTAYCNMIRVQYVDQYQYNTKIDAGSYNQLEQEIVHKFVIKQLFVRYLTMPNIFASYWYLFIHLISFRNEHLCKWLNIRKCQIVYTMAHICYIQLGSCSLFISHFQDIYSISSKPLHVVLLLKQLFNLNEDISLLFFLLLLMFFYLSLENEKH